MATVQTVLGDLDAAKLGVTLCHEHIVVGWAGFQFDSTLAIDWSALADESVRRLRELKEAGVESVVDATPIAMGRNPRFLAEVSERAGVNIICSTGMYHLGVPGHFSQMTADDLAAVYAAEIATGIEGSGVRPGVIKCASGGTAIDANARRELQAAGMAARATGLPIITHTDFGLCGDEQVRIFVEAGVDPARVMIGHSCCSGDLVYHRGLFAMGVFVGFDQIGLEGPPYQIDEVRLGCIAAHIASGHTDQVILSTDSPVRFVNKQAGAITPAGKWGTLLFRDFLPKLRARGVSDAAITQILVDNPRRLFGG